jgi:hypothetical protein
VAVIQRSPDKPQKTFTNLWRSMLGETQRLNNSFQSKGQRLLMWHCLGKCVASSQVPAFKRSGQAIACLLEV